MSDPISFRVRLLLLALVFVAFGSTLTSSFHFDDYALFSDPAITSPSGWWQVFRLEQTRPLTYFTFWLNYQVGRDNPAGYHAVNLLLHLAACWLALEIFPRLLPSGGAAVLAVVIFALHPLQTEAVAYVFARATVLSALLCLVCWRLWLDGRRGWAVACFAAALLAKEEAAALPLFLLGYEWVFGDVRGKKWRQALPAAGAMLALDVAAAARLFYAGRVTSGSGFAFDLGEITPVSYLLTQARSVWEYLWLIFMPAGLNFDRDFRLSTSFDSATLAAWLGLAALLGTALAAMRRWPQVYWFVGGLLLLAPTSSVAPLADLIAERRMYLPLVSFCLFLGFLLDRLLRDTPVVLQRFAPIGLAVVLALLSFGRSGAWQSEELLWRDTVEKSPAKIRPKLQLARALGKNGPDASTERLELLRQANVLGPENLDVALETGVFQLQAGNPAEALAEFERAAAMDAKNSLVQANRGAAFYLLGRMAEAEAAFREALAIDRCNFDARNNLILLYGSVGDVEQVRRMAEVPLGCRWNRDQVGTIEAVR